MDPSYWSEAYQLLLTAAKSDATEGVGNGSQVASVACPSCLDPLVKDILTAGKSLRLLRNSDHIRLGLSAVNKPSVKKGGRTWGPPDKAKVPENNPEVMFFDVSSFSGLSP